MNNILEKALKSLSSYKKESFKSSDIIVGSERKQKSSYYIKNGHV